MAYPSKQGLYDPGNEHDACGVGFIANIKGLKTHDIVLRGLDILRNIDHRGAVGADPLVGDGAGILIQIPDSLYRDWATGAGIDLPQPGDYGVAMCFLPRDGDAQAAAVQQLERFILKEGQVLLGWRDVPVTLDGLGQTVLDEMPTIRQCFVGRGVGTKDQDAFERKLLAISKQTQYPLKELSQKQGLEALADFYVPSFSTRTVVYKGLLLCDQVGSFYDDLRNPLTQSALTATRAGVASLRGTVIFTGLPRRASSRTVAGPPTTSSGSITAGTRPTAPMSSPPPGMCRCAGSSPFDPRIARSTRSTGLPDSG